MMNKRRLSDNGAAVAAARRGSKDKDQKDEGKKYQVKQWLIFFNDKDFLWACMNYIWINVKLICKDIYNFWFFVCLQIIESRLPGQSILVS